MYRIEVTKTAQEIIDRIYTSDRKLYERVIKAIQSLAHNPHRGKKLRDSLKGRLSLRVGNYRIIYSIQKNKLIVYIMDIGHRRSIYN